MNAFLPPLRRHRWILKTQYTCGGTNDLGAPLTERVWLAVATLLALVVAVVALTLSVGSAGPSTAAVLRKVRSAPSLIASTAKAVYVNEYSTVREQDGYVVINYRINGVFNPRTNAFKVTFTPRYPGEHLASFTYSSDGSLVYLPCDPNFRLIGKPPCIAYPAQGGGRSDWLALTYLREAQRPVTRLGERTIGSRETTGYGLTVPISADAIGALPFGTLSGPGGINSSKNFRVDVWSDTRGLIRQLDLMYKYEETSAAPPKPLTIADEERLSYGASTPRLSVPNRQTVLVASNETGGVPACEELRRLPGQMLPEWNTALWVIQPGRLKLRGGIGSRDTASTETAVADRAQDHRRAACLLDAVLPHSWVALSASKERPVRVPTSPRSRERSNAARNPTVTIS